MAEVTAVPGMDEELLRIVPLEARFEDADGDDQEWGGDNGEEEEEWDEEDEWDEDDEWSDDDEEWDEDEEEEDWEEGDWEEEE